MQEDIAIGTDFLKKVEPFGELHDVRVEDLELVRGGVDNVHVPCRGRHADFNELCRHALAKERFGKLTRHELTLRDLLIERGIRTIPQQAIGPYNCDLGANPVAVLNHSYWTSRFGNDPSVLNQTLIVNGFPMTIIGVAQKGFLSEKLGETPDIYVPLTSRKDVSPDTFDINDRRNYWISLTGRLKPGVTLKAANAEDPPPMNPNRRFACRGSNTTLASVQNWLITRMPRMSPNR